MRHSAIAPTKEPRTLCAKGAHGTGHGGANGWGLKQDFEARRLLLRRLCCLP